MDEHARAAEDFCRVVEDFDLRSASVSRLGPALIQPRTPPCSSITQVKALVMELVEGEDLAQRIARGAIPLAEALPIAKQIARTGGEGMSAMLTLEHLFSPPAVLPCHFPP